MTSNGDTQQITRRPPAPQEWENARPELFDLWMQQNLSLKEVQAKMEERGFYASPRMFKSRFAGWGYAKYTLPDDWKGFALLKYHYRLAGITNFQAEIHDRIRTQSDFSRFLANQGISEEDFLNQAISSGASIPKHVRYYPAADSASLEPGQQPKASTGKLTVGKEPPLFRRRDEEAVDRRGVRPALVDANETGYLFPEPQMSRKPKETTSPYPPQEHSFLLARQIDRSIQHQKDTAKKFTQFTSRTVNPDSSQQVDAQDSLSSTRRHSMDPKRISRLMGGASLTPSTRTWSSHAHDSVRRGGSHVGPQAARRPDVTNPRFGEESSYRESRRSHQSSASQPRAQRVFDAENRSDDLFRLRNEHNELMIDVAMACISGACDEGVKRGLCLYEATIKFGKMLASQDPMSLVVVNMIHAWLDVHDSGSSSVSLIKALFQTADEMLGRDASITIILEWLTAVMGRSVKSSRVDSTMLFHAARDFSERLGPDHPHAQMARYYHCFHMIGAERKFAEAEVELKALYLIACNSFGKASFQSVCVLAALARAQSKQQRDDDAYETRNQCIRETPLGLNHPHRLKLIMKLALICWKLKDRSKGLVRSHWANEVEKLYLTVFKGRIATLGRYHKDTEGAHETLVEILEENEKWEGAKDEVHELLVNPQVYVQGAESWWRDMVVRDREGQAPRASSEDTV